MTDLCQTDWICISNTLASGYLDVSTVLIQIIRETEPNCKTLSEIWAMLRLYLDTEFWLTYLKDDVVQAITP